jgi:hypothetical protein
MTDPDPTAPLNDDFIDRIVDGALTPGELRAAIDRLDREPDGWKRCAVAFLETQCWREAFRASEPPAGADVEVASRPIRLTAGRRSRPHGSWRSAVMAAGVVAASFTMGWLARSAGPQPPTEDVTSPAPRAVVARPDNPEPPPGTPGADDPSRLTRSVAQQLRDDRSPPIVNQAVAAVGRLRIGSEGDSPEVPILAGPGITEDWVRDQPPPVSEHTQAYWQRHGYQVDQQRRLITTTLSDGRLVTVPIDQVEFRYTGNSSL